jgi:pyruvate kinase
MEPIQIIATIGPSSKDKETITKMVEAGMSVARLNFSWGTHEEHAEFVALVREVAAEQGITIPIIQDLSGPRVQEADGHTFDPQSSVITPKDLHDLEFTAVQKPEYVALSFVRTPKDVEELRALLTAKGLTTKIIAKIERLEALASLEAVIDVSDGVMVARGDLGEALPYETVPFAKKDILRKCIEKGKPAIVATEMLTSMIDSTHASRADVTDISQAVIDGASATMLSNETASGEHPVEAVAVMKRVVEEARGYIEVPSAYRL